MLKKEEGEHAFFLCCCKLARYVCYFASQYLRRIEFSKTKIRLKGINPGEDIERLFYDFVPSITLDHTFPNMD